jgi:hypothetical protein
LTQGAFQPYCGSVLGLLTPDADVQEDVHIKVEKCAGGDAL